MAIWNEDEFYELAFSVGRSRRYHAFMREFYSRLSDWILAAQALAGTSAFVALLPESNNNLLATILTAIVAGASTLEMVFRFSRKSELHHQLCRRFTDLSAKIIQLEATQENLAVVGAERLAIEADEPTERRLVDLRAQNDEYSARGMPLDRLIPLGFWQKTWLAYLFTFGEEDIRKRMSARSQSS